MNVSMWWKALRVIPRISREEWLKAMADDGMLDDLTRTVTVDLPTENRLKELERVLQEKQAALSGLKGVPSPSYSSCWWPRPCPFVKCCFAPKEQVPSLESGFLPRDTTR